MHTPTPHLAISISTIKTTHITKTRWTACSGRCSRNTSTVWTSCSSLVSSQMKTTTWRTSWMKWITISSTWPHRSITRLSSDCLCPWACLLMPRTKEGICPLMYAPITRVRKCCGTSHTLTTCAIKSTMTWCLTTKTGSSCAKRPSSKWVSKIGCSTCTRVVLKERQWTGL